MCRALLTCLPLPSSPSHHFSSSSLLSLFFPPFFFPFPIYSSTSSFFSSFTFNSFACSSSLLYGFVQPYNKCLPLPAPVFPPLIDLLPSFLPSPIPSSSTMKGKDFIDLFSSLTGETPDRVNKEVKEKL